MLELIRQATTLVIPGERLSLASDSDDDKVIEYAVEAKAHYIVTGNMRHFPKLVRNIVTVGPRAFLDILSQSA